MAIFQPDSQGPRTLRAIYHWAWNQLKSIGSIIGDVPDNDPGGPTLIDLIQDRNRWMGEWEAGEYRPKDQVEDAGWLMIANKVTSERAAPQPTGDPFYAYDGTLTPQQVVASQAWIGSRYTPQISTQLVTGFRVYTEAGQDYRIFSVEDPAGPNPIVREIINISNAANTGWQAYNFPGTFLDVGETLDIVALVIERDPIPTVTPANYNYQTPQNPAVPAGGQIIHSRSQSDIMAISYEDADATDRTALIQGLSAGDTIQNIDTTWTVQANTPQAGYADIVVTPAVVAPTIGVQSFDFTSNAPQPIDYQQDTDYWLGNSAVKGLFIADDEYGNIIPNDDQYIIDIRLQNFDASPDWDFQANTGGIVTAQPTVDEIIWVASQASAFNVIFGQASGPTWQEIGRRTINDGEGWRVEVIAEAKMAGGFGYATNRLFGMVSRDGGTLDVDYVTAYGHSTDPLVETRIEQDGNDVVFEARTPTMQTWNFKLISYFNEIGDLL